MLTVFVEWDTKVPVWSYQGTPSYACNPQVIDPTAFGANATAMQGHLLGIRPFLEAGKVDELISILNTADVVFFATRYKWKETLDIVRKVKKPFTMLAFGMGLDQLRDGFQKEGEYEALVNLMQEVNLVTTFYERMTSYFKAMTSTPVEYLPMCYPYSYAKESYRKLSVTAISTNARKNLLIPGNVWNGELGGRRDDIGSTLIACRLAERYNVAMWQMDRKIHTQVTDPADLIVRLYDRAHDSHVFDITRLCTSLPWRHFLMLASGMDLSIHWDWCFTTGRMAADMAALGIPHVGGNSDHAEHFFPELSAMKLHEWDLDRAVEVCEDALYNKSFREHLVKDADMWGSRIDYSGWRSWFIKLYEAYR